MLGGYTGKILFVDLTTGTVKEETPPEKIYVILLGERGWGSESSMNI